MQYTTDDKYAVCSIGYRTEELAASMDGSDCRVGVVRYNRAATAKKNGKCFFFGLWVHDMIEEEAKPIS